MSDFDPASFLDTSFDQPLETVAIPVPQGEYIAIVEHFEFKGGVSAKSGKNWLKAELTWNIQDEALKQELEMVKVTVRQELMLDLDTNGKIATGKNKNLRFGRLFEACGVNEAGASPRMLVGRTAKVRVAHEPYNGQTFAKVDGVTTAS